MRKSSSKCSPFTNFPTSLAWLRNFPDCNQVAGLWPPSREHPAGPRQKKEEVTRSFSWNKRKSFGGEETRNSPARREALRRLRRAGLYLGFPHKPPSLCVDVTRNESAGLSKLSLPSYLPQKHSLLSALRRIPTRRRRTGLVWSKSPSRSSPFSPNSSINLMIHSDIIF